MINHPPQNEKLGVLLSSNKNRNVVPSNSTKNRTGSLKVQLLLAAEIEPRGFFEVFYPQKMATEDTVCPNLCTRLTEALQERESLAPSQCMSSQARSMKLFSSSPHQSIPAIAFFAPAKCSVVAFFIRA